MGAGTHHDHDERIRLHNEAIGVESDNGVVYQNRVFARAAKGDLDGALRDYDEAIRLKPDYGRAYAERGRVRQEKGDFDGALRDYDEAIRLEPDNGIFYFNRAALWESAHKYLDAVANLQKYLDLGGDINKGDQAEVNQRIQKLKNKDKVLRCGRR